jgi:hypothetical protein
MTAAADLKVVTMRESTLRDVPAQLRLLADQIERGEYGPVGCCGVAILGDTFECFGYGDGVQNDGIGPSVMTLFYAAIQRIAGSIESHGRDT